ncbi:MAG TPA: nucleotidyl transferase AbiEii/AbiGii toxin family protein [Thermoanaerobaculia bacterium]|nr:nucleotidyl transferase AbiEii/AbiGii toxin family protein [Thermoanaerobaculia bacterium]
MTRLGTHAHQVGLDTNAILDRYVLERFLYRLSVSPHARAFILKGAMLLPLWLPESARPTRDADFAGFGKLTQETLHGIADDVCRIEVEPDAVVFDTTTINVTRIRQEDEYGGHRIKVTGRIGRSRVVVQIDVGIGDAISPSPEMVELPSLLEFPQPRLRAYRPETAIAEKFHAMATHGEANSRMKDYYDVDRLAVSLSFDAAILRGAVEHTFAHRGTVIPNLPPTALTDSFAELQTKQAQWLSFVRRIVPSADRNFVLVVHRVRDFLMPVSRGEAAGTWPPGGPWQTAPRHA